MRRELLAHRMSEHPCFGEHTTPSEFFLEIKKPSKCYPIQCPLEQFSREEGES